MMKVYGIMLKNLAHPLIETLKEGNISEATMIYSTEMLSHIERLIYEAYTGDPKGYEIAHWRHMGVVDSISHRGFPSAKDTFVDFKMGTINISDWPRNREGQLMFLQQNAVVHHYKGHIWNLQRMRMCDFILRRFASNTETGILREIERTVKDVMVVEWTEYISGFVSAKHSTNENKRRGRGDAEGEINRYVEEYERLRTEWDESAHQLAAE